MASHALFATMDGPQPKKMKRSHDNRFRRNCGRLVEFVTLRGHLPEKQLIHPKKKKHQDERPTEKKQPRDPYERENAIFIDACRQRQTTMKPERKALLNSIHTGILNHFKTSRRNLRPLLGWTEQFAEWASSTTIAAVRSPKFPSTKESYVANANSFQEHMVTKSGCHLKFQPSDCCPTLTKLKPGTMADVLSYALFPRLQGTFQYKNIAYKTISFDDIPPIDYPHHSGTIIQAEATPTKLKGLIQKAEQILMPNNLLDQIRYCKTISEFHALLDENDQCFDAFHFGIGGYVYKDVGCILGLDYPQPYRTSFSCTIGRTHYFPSLGTECQELYTYGSPGRPTVDARSQAMPEAVYHVGVEAWKVSLPHLSEMCQVCPPSNCQVLMYPDLWLEDDTIPSKPKKNPLKHLVSEMRLHKDNGHRDDVTGKQKGGNVDKEVNSHSYGSDVLVVTIGDGMDFHLVSCDSSNGQNYKHRNQYFLFLFELTLPPTLLAI